MMIRLRPLPWTTHVFYLAVLAGTWLYFQRQLSDQRRLQRALGANLEAAAKALNRANEERLAAVERSADGYRNKPTEDLRNRARQVQRLVSAFQHGAPLLEGAGPSGDRETFNFAALRDSLHRVTPDLDEVRQEVAQFLENDPFLLTPARLNRYMKTIEPVDAAQLAAAQRLRAVLAGRSLLQYYDWMTMPDADVIVDRYCPVLSAQQVYPQAGQVFEADIFLSGYASHQYHTQMTVNGKPYELYDGRVKYRDTFQKPGTYLLNVRFDVKNPLTKEVRVYQRTFKVEVQP